MTRFLAILVSVTVAGLLYVYTEVEAVTLGYRIRKQEEMKTQILDRSRTLRYQVSNLKSASELEKTLAARRVELEQPKEWRTLVLAGAKAPVTEPAVTSFFRQGLWNKFFIGTAQAEARES